MEAKNRSNKKSKDKGNSIRNSLKNVSSAEKKVKTISGDKLKFILMILLSMIIFYPAYLRGLFFERQQFHTEIFVFIVFLLYCIYKQIRKEKIINFTPIHYLSIGLVIIYLITIIYAVSRHSAIEEWLKYCMYVSVFIMMGDLITNIKERTALLWVMTATGTGLCILGIDGSAGYHLSKILNSILGFMNWEKGVFFNLVSSGRINSTLQYSDSFAAYLIAAYFVTLGLFLNAKSIIQRLASGCISFLMFITFILTQSRGGYLVFIITFILFICILPKGNRTRGCVSFLVSFIPAILVLGRLSSYVSSPEGKNAAIWLMVFIGIIISTAVNIGIIYIAKWLGKFEWKDLNRTGRRIFIGGTAFLLILAVAVGAILLTSTSSLVFSNTINDHSNSVIKYMSLKPGAEYRLYMKVNAEMKENKPYAYQVSIYNITEKDLLLGKKTTIKSFEGKSTNGTKPVSMSFSVPADSKLVGFTFGNYYKGTKVEFIDSKLFDARNNKLVKNIKLKYTFLPTSLTNKIEDLKVTNSIPVRLKLSEDSLRVAKHYWLTGAGGGAWQYLYGIYQSYFYDITQTHNYYTQIWIEVGIVGVLIFLCIMLIILLMLIVNYMNNKENEVSEKTIQTVLFVAISALLIHSAMDFDLSIPAVSLFLWELLALYCWNFRMKLKINAENQLKNKFFVLTERITNVKRLEIHPWIAIIPAVIILIISVCLSSALAYETDSADAFKKNDIEKTIMYEKKSAALAPFKPEYRMDIANLLSARHKVTIEDVKQADKYAADVERLGKYNRKMVSNLIQYYLKRGSIEKAALQIEHAVAINPLNPQSWETKAAYFYQIIVYYLNKNDVTNAKIYMDKLSIMQNDAVAKNENNLVPFIFTPKTVEFLEKVRYIDDNISILNAINPNKLVFNNIPMMDVDSNGYPDQWNESENVSFTKGTGMIVKPLSVGDAWLRSINLSLLPSKSYRLTIEFNKKPQNNSIAYSIAGLTEFCGMYEDGNTYYSDFSTPAGFTGSTNELLIKVLSEYDIKTINIFEK